MEPPLARNARLPDAAVRYYTSERGSKGKWRSSAANISRIGFREPLASRNLDWQHLDADFVLFEGPMLRSLHFQSCESPGKFFYAGARSSNCSPSPPSRRVRRSAASLIADSDF